MYIFFSQTYNSWKRNGRYIFEKCVASFISDYIVIKPGLLLTELQIIRNPRYNVMCIKSIKALLWVSL